MKLVSVWLEKYMSLEDIGLNLGDENYFKFQFNQKSRKLTIEVEKTNDYFNLFTDSKIKNISGILGNNGAGKTSFLKFLNLCEAKAPIEYCAVLVLKDHETYYFYDYGNYIKRKKINIELGKSIKEILGNKVESKQTDMPFKDIEILFYSNLYSEQNDRYLKMGNNLNRSVDYVTRNFLDYPAVANYLNKYKKIPENRLSKREQFSVLKLYFDDRFRRLLNFISLIQTKHRRLEIILNTIPFPEYINLNFNEELYEQINNLIQNSSYKFERLREIIKYSLNNLDREKNVTQRFVNELIFKFFLYAFKEDLFKKTQPNTPLQEIETFVSSLNLDKDIFENISEFMLNKKNEKVFFQISKLNNILKKLTNDDYKIKIDEDRILSLYSFKIEVTSDTWEFIRDINELFEMDIDPLISFRWHSLSAGQEAILNQFMELWEGLKYVNKKNLLINIDEGELYLHPEWQRQYIDLLYNFLNYALETNYTVEHAQVLITSHSPFIASDIPKFNLMFLYREDSNENNLRPKVKIIDSQMHHPTFGGNIFDLYKNSFFVKDFFGAFSSKWIEEAFNKINDKESKFTDLQFTQFIKLIGERVIKDMLESNFEAKNDDEYEIIDLSIVAEKKLKTSEKKSIKKTVTVKKKTAKKN